MSLAIGGEWHLDKLGSSWIFGDEGLVAACPRIANARRIVQCVNAHDDLVAALEALIEMQDQLRKGGVLPADYGIVRGRAHAALAKARGGSE